MADNSNESLNFIEQFIEEDIRNGVNDGRVHTRFPPEPNGFLHIGHSKAIVLNFGLAEKYNGTCNLRFDDTNPETEDQKYVDAIKKDIEWLGYKWGDQEYYASDYFERLYELAVKLVGKGSAYVDDQSAEEISATRGTPTQPGKASPNRDRTVEENLDLLEGMKNGDFEEGAKVLRAKIDMSSPNMHMRDPVMYRIKKSAHYRRGEDWCIYPTYDWAHGQSDSIENITHSLCTLEFEVHRPLYDWFIRELEIFPSRQIEFARLNLNYTVMSKRLLLELVNGSYVNGWDDPRMLTVSGLRRRGYTPESIKNFANRIGVAKRDGIIDMSLLEFSIREHLNKIAPRKFAVMDPVKLVIENYPEDHVEMMEAVNNPEDPEAGKRPLPFTRELWIDRSDFMEDPPKKFFRLAPGREVRLKYAYIIKCEDFRKDDNGNVTEIICTYDPDTRSGSDTTGKKVKGTLSWLSAAHSLDVEIRLYDRLFVEEDVMGAGGDFKDHLNDKSLEILNGSKVEESLKDSKPGDRYQFERLGYFVVDQDSTAGNLVFNRTVTLRDTWEKIKKQTS